jgi:hypothetical protein
VTDFLVTGGMIFADHGYPSMPITYSINRTRQAQIIARTLGVDVSQVIMDDDGDGDVTITTDNPSDPLRTENLFKRWAKADEAKAAADTKTN